MSVRRKEKNAIKIKREEKKSGNKDSFFMLFEANQYSVIISLTAVLPSVIYLRHGSEITLSWTHTYLRTIGLESAIRSLSESRKP